MNLYNNIKLFLCILVLSIVGCNSVDVLPDEPLNGHYQGLIYFDESRTDSVDMFIDNTRAVGRTYTKYYTNPYGSLGTEWELLYSYPEFGVVMLVGINRWTANGMIYANGDSLGIKWHAVPGREFYIYKITP